MRVPRRTKRFVTSLIVGGLLLGTGGCGEEPTPDAAAPQLETTLSRVDDAIAARNWDRARRAVQRLIGQSGAALDAGALGPEQADRIQAAAARLLSELPGPPPQSPSPPPAPGDPETTVDEAEEPEDEEKREEREDEAEDRRGEAEEHDDDHEEGDEQ